MQPTHDIQYGECRYCLTFGEHKDIMQEYFDNGEKEVYSDIILDCFNIFLSTNSSLSRLICTACIESLRSANNFRKLVVDTENRLLKALDDKQPVFIHVPENTQPQASEVTVKVENEVQLKQESCEEEQHTPAEYHDSYDDDDYVPDDCYDSEEIQPKVKKKSVQHKEVNSEIIQGETKLLARFPRNSLQPLPTRNTLYTTCEGYVKHLDTLEGKVISSITVSKLLGEAEKPVKRRKTRKAKPVYVTEKWAHIINASTILENSNATPFRTKTKSGFPCFYCRKNFENIAEIREHQAIEHKSKVITKVFSTHGAESLVVYVDVTDLKCNLCEQNIPNLNDLKTHLTKAHKKKMHLEFADRVIPFKISDGPSYICQICQCNFETFGAIERHMNVHYRNYVCNDCGTGYITKYRLKVHAKAMHTGGSFPCDVCSKIFTTQQRYKVHKDTVHDMNKRLKCPKCDERFNEYFRRHKHMVEMHGAAPLVYTCKVCDRSFDRRYMLSRHLKRDHLEERDYSCDLCTYNCFTSKELKAHMIKHTGERIYQCSVCKKSYARKKTLTEHMRIHNNDRRFVCPCCGQAFVQKCSMKGHIKTHHVDFDIRL